MEGNFLQVGRPSDLIEANKRLTEEVAQCNVRYCFILLIILQFFGCIECVCLLAWHGIAQTNSLKCVSLLIPSVWCTSNIPPKLYVNKSKPIHSDYM